LDVSRLLGCMVDGVVEGVLLDPGQRAHPVVDASGRWVFDEGDQYPGAHPTVSAEGEWVSDDRDPEAGGLDRVVVSAPGGVREPWEYRPPSSGSESYFGAPGDLWAGMVDWWFSHDIPTEGLPSGGGLMVGPLEMAKLGNFLKDALLPLMAGDIGLAGVGGLGPFDPLPLPFGKVIGEGVKGAKAGVRAVRGAVRGGDEAVEAAARGTWSVDYPEAELVPIEFFDDMPSVNMEVERAGDVDTDLFSYKTTSEDLERLGSLAERADLGPGEFRVFATEVLGGADELELENFGALMADMETRGLDNPLVVDFDPDTGGVILGEGNHRLAAARELGWDVVPVSVRRSSVAAELALDTEKLLPPLEQLGDLPQTISPSQVGVPTAGGVARETGYRGMHTSPQRLFSEGGDTLDDLSGIYPDDVYGPDAPRLYGSHGSEYSKPNRTMKEVLHSVRGNPDAEVEVFRAVPEGVTEINPGDWVSPSRDYAVIHGEGPMRGDYQIISRKVRAGDLFTEANSLYEFGWDPS